MTSSAPTNIRLSEIEQTLLTEKVLEVNKKLVELNKLPIGISELAHFILEKSTPCVSVTKTGGLTFKRGASQK